MKYCRNIFSICVEPMKPIDVNLDLPFELKSNMKLIEKLQHARETYKSYLITI
jgi:hypothetical protein